MAWREIAMVVIAVSIAVGTYHLSRLARRLERTADVLDSLLVTTRHQLELTAEQSRDAMREVGGVGSNINEKMRKLEKVLAVTESVMESIRLTSISVNKVISSPLANMTGIVAGISRGIGSLSTRKSRGEKA